MNDFFSRCRRVVTRCIIASYNIAFLKLPLKTAVFRGSIKLSESNMIEDFKIPVAELKKDILDVWGRL